MMSPKQQATLVCMVLAMLALTATWSVRAMMTQRAAALIAADDLGECGRLAASIESLRDKPKIASAQDMGIELLGQRIAAASQQAKLDPQSLEGVYPQGPRRLGNTPYVQKPTTLTLRNVKLPQLAAFLYHLTEGESGLNVRDLRLRVPRGDSPSDVWDAEATITCLIYQPPADTNRRP